MYAKRAYRRRRPAVKKARRVARKPSGARKSITKIVKSVINRQAEIKEMFDYGLNQPITIASSSTPTFKNLVPTVGQGTQTSQRIGNQIRVKSGYIKGHVNLLPYSVSTNPGTIPLYVKMWILSCKNVIGANLGATSIGSTFFDITNGTLGLQGTMLDMDFPVNNDVWTVHASKTLKLGVGAITSTGPIGTNNYYDNSSFSQPFYFNIGKYMSTLKYDDGVTNVATNKCLWFVIQAVNADGSLNNGTQPAEFHYSTKVSYVDY